MISYFLIAVGLDVTKRAIRVESIRFAGQNGSIGLQVNQVVGRVELTRIFQTIFFFFEINAICQLFLIFLTMIRFSLVILLPLTNYH